ncbi:MAG: dienelactone hydrolase family protein [Asticcacaulis sp.]
MFKSMDTLAQRYALLKPSITVFGPDDDVVRPAVVLFHGCGGLRPHVSVYAQAAALTGARAYVVDSFAPRGWDRMFAASMICTGAVMQGYERSGDVLATLWGLKSEGRTDMDNIVLVGFSHGGWSIMDLMTEPLKRPGEAKLADPDASLADKVKGVFLVYPYINFPARTNFQPWVRQPVTFAVLAKRDHLTPYGHSVKIFDKLKKAGVAVDTLSLDASHAFDEETNKGGIMKYDPDAMRTSMEAMLAFMAETQAVPA